MKYTIYKITNIINGMCYVGQHILKDEYPRSYMGKGLAIREAYKEYGRFNFTKEILEIVEDDTPNRAIASEREKYWIQKLNTMEPNGYNRHPGGIGGCTKDSGAKGVATRKLHGYRHSEKTKHKISVAKTGKPFTESHKQHLADNHRLRKIWTLVHESGTESQYDGSMHDLVKSIGVSFNKFIRHSYKHEFVNGIYIKDIKKDDYAILRDLLDNSNKQERGK